MGDSQAGGSTAPAPVPVWHPIQQWLERLGPAEWAVVRDRYLLARYGQLDPASRRQDAAAPPGMTVIVFDGARVHQDTARALVEVRCVTADGSQTVRALVSVFDQDRARIRVPELEGLLCFTFTPNEADERVQRRATEMLATLETALAEYRHEQWQQWFDDVGELIAGAAAAILGMIARVWAWGVRTYRSEPALVDHSPVIAAGAAVLTVLALTGSWAWGWPGLVYLVALAAGFVTAVAVTVALDTRRHGPSA